MRKLALAVTFVSMFAAGVGLSLGPPAFLVECATTVAAPAEVLVAQVADLQRWPAWSPDEAGDPRISRRFGGLPGSPGATYYWSGNARVGKGRMTVTRVGPDRVELELESEGALIRSADLEVQMLPEGAATQVRWTIAGENDLVERLLWNLRGRHRAIVASIGERLARLKGATEALPAPRVERLQASARVDAPAETIRSCIADLRRWSEWSPWSGDAAGAPSYGGAASGIGASAYWSSGAADRRGRVTVVADGPEHVELEVEVSDASRRVASNDLEFRLAPEGGATRVTWTTSGDGGLDALDLREALDRLKELSEGRDR